MKNCRATLIILTSLAWSSAIAQPAELIANSAFVWKMGIVAAAGTPGPQCIQRPEKSLQGRDLLGSREAEARAGRGVNREDAAFPGEGRRELAEVGVGGDPSPTSGRAWDRRVGTWGDGEPLRVTWPTLRVLAGCTRPRSG